jgi:predicted nucleic acid-binding protein
MTPERLKIVNYVTAASELAEELTRNLKNKSRTISDEVVVSLGKFYKAAKAMQNILDLIEKDNRDIQ